MPTQPVILLVFSNDEDAYLPKIHAEQKAIKDTLLDFSDKNYLHVRDVQRAATKDIFYLINRYNQRVAIFHYAGHADGQSLQLEAAVGTVQSARVQGIAGLLGTQQHLKLVFLNGCATRGQVTKLIEQGVPAVIATSVKIDDDQAQLFSSEFYRALSTGSSIGEAFKKARSLLETQDNPPAFQSRGFIEEAEEGGDQLPWGLYWKTGGEDVLEWKLPTESPFSVDLRTDSMGGPSAGTVNQHLVGNAVLKAIQASPFFKELIRKLKREKEAGNSRKMTDSEKKDVIIRTYPLPISVQLRTLFSDRLSEKYNEERLRQLVATYRIALQFFSFSMLSDLWDATLHREQPLDLSEEERLQLQAFFELNASAAPSFDYFQLAHALLEIARRNEVQFYLEQLNDYPNGWKEQAELSAANSHFQQMQTALEADIPSRLIEAYCDHAEQQLAKVLIEFAYLLHYKMAVIKNIEVVQIKNLPPRKFKHALVELDNSHNDIGHRDRWQELEDSIDMESVLLYRNQLFDSLNLSPFILDENALIREFNSKLYFFSHRSDTGLHFHWVENEADKLEIEAENFPTILQQFARVRRDLLNETIQAESKPMADTDSDDGISEFL